MKRQVSRREFLRLSAVATVGVVVASCAPEPTPVPPTAVPPTKAPVPTVAPAPTTAPVAAAPTAVPPTAAPTAIKYTEAPVLADLVKAGKLPPIEQRLPKNPMVMVGYEGIGKHGGLWRRAYQGVSDINGPTKVVDRAWGWFDKNLNLIPRLLESWSVSPDGKGVDHQDAPGTQVVGWQRRIYDRRPGLLVPVRVAEQETQSPACQRRGPIPTRPSSSMRRSTSTPRRSRTASPNRCSSTT